MAILTILFWFLDSLKHAENFLYQKIFEKISIEILSFGYSALDVVVYFIFSRIFGAANSILLSNGGLNMVLGCFWYKMGVSKILWF